MSPKHVQAVNCQTNAQATDLVNNKEKQQGATEAKTQQC